jgi:hypothetical protein
MNGKRLRECPPCMLTLAGLVLLWSLSVWVVIGRWRDRRPH